ncbi:class I SAM-dependent methyltransferase [Leptolyngbya sp. NIES-2104]|uniref:class I SAM-dependent methyltransferase n=1 Tax=Leptolyngbya sp. NIES-2104 TaxID=1552121 RepID=UPI0006EC6D7B|nr:class I SAM-dependent methyltransferase [Leptolyngbya sp. NIES-2104]GAP97213.1 3-demethylubiquinone-9 3-methyltransferase [Leptolyngbya sp. NIES-2104]
MEQEIYESWNQKAQDWDIQVGDLGDRNRILNSDPVLWQFVGDVNERLVLDAGCGTGYLSRQLAQKGAIVTGIDLSSEMIALAQQKSAGSSIDFHQDSCSELRTLPDEDFDLLVSNYVLMDLPDLEEAIQAFYRVLKPGGVAVLVFSHPCFDQGAAVLHDDRSIIYHWKESYFGRQKRQDLPWKHFTSDFIWFHRPLSDYWKAFKAAGFDVIDFEEPRLKGDRAHLAKNEQELFKCQNLPYSVVFKLSKPS